MAEDCGRAMGGSVDGRRPTAKTGATGRRPVSPTVAGRRERLTLELFAGLARI